MTMKEICKFKQLRTKPTAPSTRQETDKVSDQLVNIVAHLAPEEPQIPTERI